MERWEQAVIYAFCDEYVKQKKKEKAEVDKASKGR